ncbi:KaiC 1 [Thiocapsa imhoffii]|uniref:non-specific serine/threonine protein kinase n=1 Tax=Thiocapsa imhoffii TaxID=382777 RepID=A0A9X0WFE4_9GAMM|nr:circadian clock protein KaiC [Thiocapsa imhoffii]MBK1643709.1 KaiC 1 [Thiocapsa imhoffii]
MIESTTDASSAAASGISKCPTGIFGFDEITGGGLPRGRPTLLAGAAGCGKTLLSMEFIVRGARDFGEHGVFMSFEESEQELITNVRSLGFDLATLVTTQRVALDAVRIERSEIEETGDYDLEGLFIRLGSAIDAVGARRVALDGVDALFASLPSEAILRGELRRLFRWLKAREVTAIITGERGGGTLTRHGLEEYVSDCVIFLDHRISNQVATRRLRIIKYRGSRHGTNEYPILIDAQGFGVLPISSAGLDHRVSRDCLSTGIDGLDALLGRRGYYKGSSVLVSGTAGAGKSSLAAAFADSVCHRGGRCLYWSSEESPDQIARNMASIGFDLEQHFTSGRLYCHAVRPTLYGLEDHLARLHRIVGALKPDAVILDPISSFTAVGNLAEVRIMLTRVIDFLKSAGITAFFTGLTQGSEPVHLERTEECVSSLIDTWLLLRMTDVAGTRKRLLHILKSRGMAHSHQVHQLLLDDCGVSVVAAASNPGEPR